MWIEVGIGEYMRKIFSYKREKIVFIVHNADAVTGKKTDKRRIYWIK